MPAYRCVPRNASARRRPARTCVLVVVVVFCPQNENAAAVLPTLLAVLLAVAVVKALGLLYMAKRAWKSSARLGDASDASWALALALAWLLLAVVAARYALAADTAEKPVASDAAEAEELVVVVVVVVAALGTPGTGDVALGTYDTVPVARGVAGVSLLAAARYGVYLPHTGVERGWDGVRGQATGVRWGVERGSRHWQ